MKKKYIAIIKTALLAELSTATQAQDFYRRYPDTFPGRAESMQKLVNAIYEKFPQSDLAEGIAEAEKRARARCITPYDVIKGLLQMHEKGMHGAPFAGVAIQINPHAQKFPVKYRGIPQSTWVCAIYDGAAWKITKIYRAECNGRPYRITWTERAKQAVIEDF